MAFVHKELAKGRWKSMSLAEQIGNIGAELSRAHAMNRRGLKEYEEKALERALELIDLTLGSVRTAGQFREVARLREVVAGLYVDTSASEQTFQELENFYLPFAVLARR